MVLPYKGKTSVQILQFPHKETMLVVVVVLLGVRMYC